MGVNCFLHSYKYLLKINRKRNLIVLNNLRLNHYPYYPFKPVVHLSIKRTKIVRTDMHHESSSLTIARVCIARFASTSSSSICACGLQGVGALVCEVTSLPLTRNPWTRATQGSSISHPNLTELLIDLQTFQTQLLHLLSSTHKQTNRSQVHTQSNRDPLQKIILYY